MTAAARRPLTVGWVIQPAYFYSPPGIDPRAIELARSLIRHNEEHLALAVDGGFDTVWVEDHMGWGDKAHLECLTNLAWLAGRHPGPTYGTMVCGQAFRNPAYLAKVAVNLSLLTEGRFILGLGAGNNGAEHHAFGFPFAPPPERVAQTEEAVRVMRALWQESPATVHGRHYRVEEAHSSPLPDRPIPLMIGGGGERRMLRLVAREADWWCADIGPVELFARRAAILADHCAAVGRDPAEIVKSQVVWVSVEEEPDRLADAGDLHLVRGSSERVADELAAYRAAGVDHFQVRFMDYPETAGLRRFIDRVLPQLRRGEP